METLGVGVRGQPSGLRSLVARARPLMPSQLVVSVESK